MKHNRSLLLGGLCAATLLAGAARPVRADSRYMLRADPAASSPGTPAVAMTVSQRGGAERWDITIPQAGSPQDMTVLMPPNLHQVLTIMPDMKGYGAFPLALAPPDPFGIPFILMSRSMPSVPNTQGASIGKMISTYQIRDLGPVSLGVRRCEHYAVMLRLQMENIPENEDMSMSIGLWLDPGKGATTAVERLSPVETVHMADGSTLTREIQGDRKALASIAGRMPVKMTLSVDGHVLTFTLADHSTGPLAASVFQIPMGYQEITPTAMPQTAAPTPVVVQPAR